MTDEAVVTEVHELSTETLLSATSGAAPPPRALWRRALGLWRTRIGLALVVLLVGIAIIGPWLAPYGETEFVGTQTVVVD